MNIDTMRTLLEAGRRAWDTAYPGTRYLVNSECDAALRTVKANLDAALKELDASAH